MTRTKVSIQREITALESTSNGLPEEFWAEKLAFDARLEDLKRELETAPDAADERDTSRRQPSLSSSRTARHAALRSIGKLPGSNQRAGESA